MFWILTLLGTLGFGANHGFYIGVIDIYPSQPRPIVITVFTDDLENALFNHFNSHTLNDSTVNSYFQTHFQVAINNKPVSSRVEQIEQLNDNTCKLFLMVATPEKWYNMRLEASFFMELYPTQNNIVRVHSQPTLYFRLTKQKKSCNFFF